MQALLFHDVVSTDEFAARLFAGEIPGHGEVAAMPESWLRELLLGSLNVRGADVRGKSKVELVELVLLYARTEVRCRAARSRVATNEMRSRDAAE